MTEQDAGTRTDLPDPSTMTYERAKAELRNIVSALESGSIPLEETLNLWQRGEKLAARCKLILDEAAARIEAAEAEGETSAE